MPKRRRERDKPKSGPEALYNPNKRVLLSYASDEEEETVDDTPKQPASVNASEAAVDDRTLANYQMDEYPDSDTDAVVDAEVDQYAPVSELEDVEDETLSGAPDEKVTDDWGPPNRRDPVTLQWPTLGPAVYGEDVDEDEEYDPETEEAMAYLRAVRSVTSWSATKTTLKLTVHRRSERYTIPEILSAPRQFQPQADADNSKDTTLRTGETQSEDDDSDGTFIQVAPLQPVATPAEDDATNPQEVFTRLLVERFMEQRKQLHLPPSMNKLTELPDSCPISFPQGNNKASAEWYRLLHTKAPLPAQLRSMDHDSVFNILALVQNQYLVKKCTLSKVTSAWIWSLLARLDDVGTMTNDEVSPIRELGKRAVFLLLSFTNPELAAGLESLGHDALPIAAAESATGEIASASLATENTLATLDMVLVVIGEAFGQKDLLEFRPTWTAVAQTA